MIAHYRIGGNMINIDTQCLNTYSAIIQLSKNEEVVLIDLIEACDHAVLCGINIDTQSLNSYKTPIEYEMMKVA